MQLAAVYFVEPGDGTGVVTERLVEWYRRNGAALNFGGAGALPVRLRALIDGVAEAGDRPETATGFWDCLAGLVAMGWSDAAADLVALHSCWAEWRQGMAAAKPAAELLEAVVALIGTAPRMATADEERPRPRVTVRIPRSPPPRRSRSSRRSGRRGRDRCATCYPTMRSSTP